MKTNKQKGIIGFLVRKHLVKNKRQAQVVLLSLSAIFYMISGYIFFSVYAQSTQARDFVEKYQHIDQSKTYSLI